MRCGRTRNCASARKRAFRVRGANIDTLVRDGSVCVMLSPLPSWKGCPKGREGKRMVSEDTEAGTPLRPLPADGVRRRIGVRSDGFRNCAGYGAQAVVVLLWSVIQLGKVESACWQGKKLHWPTAVIAPLLTICYFGLAILATGFPFASQTIRRQGCHEIQHQCQSSQCPLTLSTWKNGTLRCARRTRAGYFTVMTLLRARQDGRSFQSVGGSEYPRIPGSNGQVERESNCDDTTSPSESG